MNKQTYISATEAAQLAGVTSETIRNLCKAGMLSYQMHGTRFYPSREDVERYAETILEVSHIEHRIDDYKLELLAAEEEMRQQLQFLQRTPQQIAALHEFFQALVTSMFRDEECALTPRECKIIYDVLTGKPFAEVGAEQHLTLERVRQIWSKALRKWSMRQTLLQKKDEEIKRLQQKVNILLFGPNSPEAARLLSKPLAECDLSVRTVNCLTTAGLETVGDLVKLKRADLLKFRNIGSKNLTELDEWLEAHGLCFAEG